MDLSKAFDCIPHDLLIAKLHAYGLSFDKVTFLNLYLKDRKQNVRINSICSAFQNILSGVPQGSISGPILFNIFLNDLFLCIKRSDLHDLGGDNTVTATCNTLTRLLKTLEQECESAVNWFKQNEMIVNAETFRAIILNKKESEAKYELILDNNDIESTKSVKLLGITIDDRQRVDQHISSLCSKAAMELNVLGRLQKYMGKPEKVAVVKSFIYANFNYCLVWHFSNCESIRKIEKIQKRCLRIVLDYYDSDYDVMLRKSRKVTMEIKRLRVLAIEILKTVNNLNPNYMKDIFIPKLHPKVRPNDILVKHHYIRCQKHKKFRS